MKILIIGKFSEDQFGFHISDTLKEMGHSIIEFESGMRYKYYNSVVMRRLHQANQFLTGVFNNFTAIRQFRLKNLDKVLSENKIDLIITTHDFLFPNEADYIKKKSGAPLALWFPDSVSGFNKAMFIIAPYDFLFFKDPYIVSILRDNYNIRNAFYLPECFNPKHHNHIELTDKDRAKYGCDISTYGGPHVFRIKLFSQLQNYNVKIWGHHLPVWVNDKSLKNIFTGEYVTNNEKAKAVLSAKINLNTLLPGEIIGINARTFEVAGIGGFQMIHWRPGLNQLFEDEKEIVAFKNFESMKNKLGYFLEHERERKKIAEAGYLRAHKEHTYELRLKLMLDIIFENKKGFPFFGINSNNINII